MNFKGLPTFAKPLCQWIKLWVNLVMACFYFNITQEALKIEIESCKAFPACTTFQSFKDGWVWIFLNSSRIIFWWKWIGPIFWYKVEPQRFGPNQIFASSNKKTFPPFTFNIIQKAFEARLFKVTSGSVFAEVRRIWDNLHIQGVFFTGIPQFQYQKENFQAADHSLSY